MQSEIVSYSPSPILMNSFEPEESLHTSVDAKLIYSFVRNRSAYMCKLGLGLVITWDVT